MSIPAPRLLVAAAAAVVLAACADAPDSTGPETPPNAGAVRAQLPQWFREASPAVLALPGTIFADHDETTDLLVFGVENDAAIPAVRQALARLGVPASAYAVRIARPIRQVATLRSQWRPTVAGIQIHFSQFLCTLGFNADDGAERSFITASHCTRHQGRVGRRPTEYFQPTSTVDPTVIALEAEDPDYFRGGDCPRGRKCRYSDAARARYSDDVASTRGAIAMTSGPNNGSLEVTGAFTVTSQDDATTDFSGGTTVHKVGRTTGWTRGEVTGSCVDVNVFASNITMLCQTLVEDPNGAQVVGGGDSGAGVFIVMGGNNVQLVGILWGGSTDDTQFVFSPLKLIQDELGALAATN